MAMFIAWFLMVFLVLFPKGGFKIGPLPLTWGYLFLAGSTPFLLLIRLLVLPLRIPMRAFVALCLTLPMQILLLYAVVFYGISSFGFFISTVTGFVVFPILFLAIYPPFFQYVDGVRLSHYFRWCILLAAVWGIFLFILHPITGKFVEIPFLTVNAGDYGELENTKHINRGLFFKLISTYNNGNLYGVCTLMLMPMYDLWEDKRWRRLIVKLALLMTLSRTVWAGLILSEALSVVVLLAGQLETFPRLYLGKATQRAVVLLVTIGFVLASLLFNSSSIAFLLDPTFGNRTGEISIAAQATFLPSTAVDGLQEVAYTSAAQKFGFTGGAAFFLLMFSPILLLLVDTSAWRSPMRRAALKGLVLYMFLAAVDAAFNFIPTMAFYWFVYMIYVFGWPAAHRLIGSRMEGPVPEELSPALTGATVTA